MDYCLFTIESPTAIHTLQSLFKHFLQIPLKVKNGWSWKVRRDPQFGLASQTMCACSMSVYIGSAIQPDHGHVWWSPCRQLTALADKPPCQVTFL